MAFALVDDEDYEDVMRRKWCLDGNGYVCASFRIDGVKRMDRLHRYLLGLRPGNALEGDHKNRNRLDNRRSNLRIVTRAQQLQNRSGSLSSRSRFRGVGWHLQKKKWRAYVNVDGRQKHLGYFDLEIDAARAAKSARERFLPYSIEPDIEERTMQRSFIS